MKDNVLVKIAAGLVIGFTGGFFGGGGGMIAVPVLTYIFAFEKKCAHATAILVILPVTVFAAVVYFFKVGYDAVTLLVVALGVVSGGVAGAKLLKKLPQKAVAIAFILLIAASGVKLSLL